MAREMLDTYHGYEQADVLVAIPEGHDHAGSWHGNIVARLVDQDTDEWFFRVRYTVAPSESLTGTFPVEWCRRPELDDFAGIIPLAHLDRMRHEERNNSAPDPHADCLDCECGMRGPAHCEHAHLAWG